MFLRRDAQYMEPDMHAWSKEPTSAGFDRFLAAGLDFIQNTFAFFRKLPRVMRPFRFSVSLHVGGVSFPSVLLIARHQR